MVVADPERLGRKREMEYGDTDCTVQVSSLTPWGELVPGCHIRWPLMLSPRLVTLLWPGVHTVACWENSCIVADLQCRMVWEVCLTCGRDRGPGPLKKTSCLRALLTSQLHGDPSSLPLSAVLILYLLSLIELYALLNQRGALPLVDDPCIIMLWSVLDRPLCRDSSL